MSRDAQGNQSQVKRARLVGAMASYGPKSKNRRGNIRVPGVP